VDKPRSFGDFWSMRLEDLPWRNYHKYLSIRFAQSAVEALFLAQAPYQLGFYVTRSTYRITPSQSRVFILAVPILPSFRRELLPGSLCFSRFFA